MFNFFKKKTSTEIIDEKEDDESSISLGAGVAATESARVSTQAAAQKFAKPTKYDRSILDDGAAKINSKKNAFKSGVEVKDQYTGDALTLTKAEAKMKYGDDWTKHLAESDHKISLKKRYEQTKDNPWLSNDNIKASSNSSDNLEVVSRKFNNAKRSRSNEEFVTDDTYLEKTGVKLSEQGKSKAIESEKKIQKVLKRRDFKDSTGNILKTGHNAGKAAAKNSGVTGMTMSGIMNFTAVIKGEKSAEDAIADTVVDSGKAAATGYIMGGGLTTISHTLTGSSSKFLRALSESNVPGKIITAVIVTGDTIKRYGDGEITTQECLIELGEKGLNFATTGYSMAVGQAIIPIPVVGAAVGALVGSVITSNYYNQLMTSLQNKQLEHQERLRIIAECEKATREARAFREELEIYLSSYFREYQDCFDDALSTIQMAFEIGNAEGVITGANQITCKLGGKVHYDNMNEFKDYLFDDTTDIL
ncbi:hypothetical protein [Anaerotignum sp.]|uniref:hypothetical protein n=1 Tax=Anaerotignum sp. TaxID=2039241 RepID=UPI00289CF9AC|nr:hypothetical protein [Anaerotignum sp.]